MYLLPSEKKIRQPSSGYSNYVWMIVVGSVFLFFLLQIFDLQIINGEENFVVSQQNASDIKVIDAPRGSIITSDGVKVAYDKVLYEVILNADSIPECIGLDKNDLPNSNKISITQEQFNNCVEKGTKFGSFSTRYTRYYPFGEVFSNVVGFTGSPNKEELANMQYSINSNVGRDGLESFYESYLKGEDGYGIDISRFDGSQDLFVMKSPEAGSDLNIAIDSRWQNLLYIELQKVVEKEDGLGGAGVIMNTRTGDVVSMVSYPGFDNNQFTDGMTESEYNALVGDIRTPLVNKAISMQASPGSTFKPFVAAVALELGILDPNSFYDSRGCEYIDSTIKFCEADQKVLGNVNLDSAISRSSNLYFCNVGRSFDKEYGYGNGITYLLEGLDKFGVGKKTGVDLYGEMSGHVSSPEYIQKTQSRQWSIGDMCNTVIGQGDILLTPIQAATFIGAFKNGGIITEPNVVENVKSSDGVVEYENLTEEVNLIGLSEENLKILNTAMRNTVEDVQGSGHLLINENVYVTIKTGSADTSETLVDGSIKTGAHSWILGTFDFEEETYSFAIVGQFLGRGYKTVPVIANFVSCIDSDYKQGCSKY